MDPATSDSSGDAPIIEIDVLGMLRRRWQKVVFGMFVGLSLAGLYYFATARVYESEVEILVGQRSSEVTNNGTLNNANASGDAIQEDQLATHMRLFVSRRMLAGAIRRRNLDQLDSFKQAAANDVSGIDHILENVEVLRGGEGSASDAMVLRASYRDTDPEHAALVLSSVYESYRVYVESHGHNSTEHAVELMRWVHTHRDEATAMGLRAREYAQSVLSLDAAAKRNSFVADV